MYLKLYIMINMCLNMAQSVSLSITTVYVIYPYSLDPFVLIVDWKASLNLTN